MMVIEGMLALLSFLHFIRPPFDAFSSAPYSNVDLDVLHTFRVLQEGVTTHPASIGSSVRRQVQHWQQKI